MISIACLSLVDRYFVGNVARAENVHINTPKASFQSQAQDKVLGTATVL